MKILKSRLHLLLFFALCNATITTISAQSTISSPYSRFGVGELLPQYNLRSSAMGGISQGLNYPGEINFANPASYASFDSLTFLFDFGFSGSFNTMKTNLATSNTSNASVNYITFGFPVLKWWRTAIGLIPVSSVGYNIYDEEIVEDMGRMQHLFIGDGAYNRAFWGNSFRPFKNLSIGINIGYMFGNGSYTRILYFVDSTNMRTTNVYNDIYISDFTFEPGIQYSAEISSKDRLTIGATVNIPKKMKAERSRFVFTDYDNSGSYVDTIEFSSEKGGYIYLPATVKAGFSYERSNKWIVGVDFNWSNWAKYKTFGTNDSLSNCWGINVGGEYTPNDRPSAKYGQRIAYRLGFKTRQKILQINDININEYTVSYGMGLPLTRSKTKINCYIEWGTKGTTALIKENCFKIGIGLSLSEMWFYKRQYR